MTYDADRKLPVLKITEPCGKSWDAMTGSNKTRFCAHCQKSVHDLSAMTVTEAEKLFCQTAGPLCVRFAQTQSGEPITLEYQNARPNRRRWLWPLTAAASLAAAIVGTVYATRPSAPGIMMGEIAPPPGFKMPATQTNPTTAPTTSSPQNPPT